MDIDPRLDEIDDCLYRVAVRALIIQQHKVLLVKEQTDSWWALPGGGVDHGETIESALAREVEEELGVPTKYITSKFQIAHYTIGSVVSAVPRMNLYFKVSIPEKSLEKTTHVTEWKWFTKNELLELDMNSSYDKSELADVIFGADVRA